MSDIIQKPVNELATHIVISQSDRAIWRDGIADYYKVIRDLRPDAIDNPQELGDGGQTYWKLYHLAHEQSGLDAVPDGVKKELSDIKELYELADAYSSHVLAQLLDKYEKYEVEK